MFETLDKVMLAGIGALAMTRDRAEKIFDDYVARGEQARADKSGFVREVMDSADKARAELEKLVAEQVQSAVAKLDLATKQDVERLEKKLDKLIKQTSS